MAKSFNKVLAKYHYYDNMIRVYDRIGKLMCILPYDVPVFASVIADHSLDLVRLRRNNSTWKKVKEPNRSPIMQCKVRWR